MKKRYVMIAGLLVAALLMVTACTGSGQKQNPSTTGGTSVVNPMVQYNSVNEINQKLGYRIGELPKYTNFEVSKCFIIDDATADLRYTRSDNAEATVRTQKNATGDISGVQNVEYTKGSDNGHEYFLGKETSDKVQTAYFVKEDQGNTYTYSLSATGMDNENFMSCLQALMGFVYN